MTEARIIHDGERTRRGDCRLSPQPSIAARPSASGPAFDSALGRGYAERLAEPRRAAAVCPIIRGVRDHAFGAQEEADMGRSLFGPEGFGQ